MQAGKIKNKVDVQHALENAPATLRRLFEGRNEGKQLLLDDCTVSDEAHAPFGGVKNSGFGREGGQFSTEEMTELKWITIQSGQRAFPM